MAVRGVLFDLDGTLIDTMSGFADVAASVMAEHHGLPRATARRRYLETSGVPFAQQLEIIVPDHPANAAASTAFETRKRVVCDEARMTHETVRALERLRAAGLALVVSSNGAQHFVDEFQTRETFAFDLCLGFDAERGLAKGAPHVARACEVLGLAPADLVFCGDSLADGDLARATGLSFVGRLGTFTRADFLRWDPRAYTVDDIAALAASLLARRAA